MTRRIAQAALPFLIAAVALAPAASAGKPSKPAAGGGGGTGSSLTLVLLNSTDGTPHWGQQVTFSVSTTATTQPMVKLECFQAGVRVYHSSAGFYPGYPWPWAQTFTLSSGAWTGGAASCTASLYHWNGRRYVTLKTLSFAAAA
jgi:hypothetical protein